MNPDGATSDTRMARLEQAAEWLQRLHSGAEDEGVMEAWLDWCQRDPLNQQAFDELAAVWEASAGIVRDQPMTGRVRPRRYALAASLAVLAATAITGAWWASRPAPDQLARSEFTSPTGVNTTRTLADGSQLELGGGTRVSVAIGPRARRIQLHEGELYVTVQKDPARPFSVDTGRLEVIATGTAFNVLRSEGRTTVTVAEGSVDALYEGRAAARRNVPVASNQQLVYSHQSRGVEVHETDPAIAIAWRTGTLKFSGEPLSEVIASVNRYAARRIVIEDARVGAFGFLGTARVDSSESIDGWLASLTVSFPVVVETLADGRQLIRPRPGALRD